MRNLYAQQGLPSRHRQPHPRSFPPYNGGPMGPASANSSGSSSSAAPNDSVLKNNQVSRDFFQHTSAQRIDTSALIVDSIREEYPQLHLTVVPQYPLNLFSYAAAGYATVAPIDKESDRLVESGFEPPFSRVDGGHGAIYETVKFGKYLLEWQGKEFVMYVADCRDGTQNWSAVTMQYILSSSVESTNNLLLAAGPWSLELHGEVWVFDQGYWEKDPDLWRSVQKASWDDVILKQEKKDAIISDAQKFFDSKDTYERLNVPWKRGIIYYGPPGNGKTISIKAMMHMLYKRKPQVPTLYVKSLKAWFGPEESINQIFSLARRQAPCYLIFEDLDSIVSDEVRSFFLNAVDGIQRNDGILMVGSTNHLDRLDPGIAKRPSRFDRKILFDNPDKDERILYMQFWQRKLSSEDDVEFPDKLCPAIANITKDFSFAYLQEAMVASLLAIANEKDVKGRRLCLECMETHPKPNGSTCNRDSSRPFKGLHDWVWMVRQADDEDPDLDEYRLWREVKKQVRILREELDTHSNRK